MAKRGKSDPIIESMVDAFIQLVEAMVIHSMGTGGPNASIQVIEQCIDQMEKMKQQTIEVKMEIENNQTATAGTE